MDFNPRIEQLAYSIKHSEDMLDEWKKVFALASEVADGLLQSTRISQKEALKIANDYRTFIRNKEKELEPKLFELDYLRRLESPNCQGVA